MRAQPADEPLVRRDPISALALWQHLDLRDALSQPVLDRYIMAEQVAQQLVIVIARHTERLPRLDHPPRQRHRRDDLWPAIHQIADEDETSTLWMAHRGDLVALVAEQI